MAEINAKIRKLKFGTPGMNRFNKTIIRDEIQWLLEAISEQFEIIASYEDKIPQIEFDIILENVRKLYESLRRLNRLDDPAPLRAQSAQEAPEQKPVIPAGNENSVGETRKVKTAGHSAVKIRVDSDPGDGTQPEMRKPIHEPGEIDLFQAENAGFTERLKEAHEKSHGPGKHSSRQQDLKAAISINEKFLFINELFDGNLREYNLAIEALNTSPDLNTAFEHLDLLRKKNLWESESPAFRKLVELLEEKF